MTANIYGFAVLFVVSIGTAAIIFGLVYKSLRSLLDEVIKLPEGTTFYTRLFLVGLVLVAGSAMLEEPFNLKAGSPFMEFTWKVAEGLSEVFGDTCLFLVAYLALVTILVATLRRKNEQ